VNEISYWNAKLDTGAENSFGMSTALWFSVSYELEHQRKVK
jgi:hypothetical protein